MKRGVVNKQIVCLKQGECLMILQPHNISTVAGMPLRKLDMAMKPVRQHMLDMAMKPER